MTDEDCAIYAETAKDRLFTSLHQLETEATKKPKKSPAEKEEQGFNRLAASSSQDRDGWIALLTRLATRPTLNLSSNEENGVVKQENDDRAIFKKGGSQATLPDKLREAFHLYVMDDWRRRLDIAIAWLNEEWYADRLAHPKNPNNPTTTPDQDLPNYTPHTLHLLDSLVPYIDTRDGRHLIRFLSEIPYLPQGVWGRIEKLAEDPERGGVGGAVFALFGYDEAAC